MTSKADDILPERLPLSIEVTDTEMGLESLRAAPYFDKEREAEIARAGVILMPWPGWGSYQGPVFHQKTSSLYRYLSEKAPPHLKPEIPVKDDDYRELALHADVVFVPLLLATIESAAAVINLIAAWLQYSQLKRFDRTDVDMTLVIEDRQAGLLKAIHYRGPANKFEECMSTAVSKLNLEEKDDPKS